MASDIQLDFRGKFYRTTKYNFHSRSPSCTHWGIPPWAKRSMVGAAEAETKIYLMQRLRRARPELVFAEMLSEENCPCMTSNPRLYSKMFVNMLDCEPNDAQAAS